jgi:hypothetical protein
MFHDQHQFGLVRTEDVYAFESRHAIVLPESYRAFLLHQNGGVPVRDCCVFEEREEWTTTKVDCIFGLHAGPDWAQLEATVASCGKYLPASAIPVARDSFGNYFLLFHTGSRAPKVYFWDHESSSGPEDFECLSFVATDFTAFIDGLVESEPENA